MPPSDTLRDQSLVNALLADSVKSGVIDVRALGQLRDANLSVRLVDCRFNLADTTAGERAYADGHLPDAVFADLERDLSGPIVRGTTGRHPLPDVATLTQRFGAWGIEPNTLVVTYDDGSSMFAPRLWWLLRWLGHERVVVLRGGLPAWVSAGNELSRVTPTPPAATFEARPNSAMLASVEEVSEIVSQTNTERVLLDARAEARYRGEQEPIDPVAGHIPTAKNLPYTSLVDAGAPRETTQVQADFARVVGSIAPRQVIAYCGSGVTACALIWASHAAGLSGVRLYPGSWSEWVTDPSRPIARGTE